MHRLYQNSSLGVQPYLHHSMTSAGIWTCKWWRSFLLSAELPGPKHQFCYSLADRASKQDLDSVSSGKQRTNPQTQSTLSTIMCFLVYYTYTARAYGNYNSRGIMGHDPHNCNCLTEWYKLQMAMDCSGQRCQRQLCGMLLKLVTGNGEPGTGVWERVYSGNPPENSIWRTKEKKREQFGQTWESVTVVKVSFYRLCPLIMCPVRSCYSRVRFDWHCDKQSMKWGLGENGIGIITSYVPDRSGHSHS